MGLVVAVKEVEYIVVIHKEETTTHKFRCYASDSSKEDLWRLGFILTPLIIVTIFEWKMKDTMEPNLFHFFGLQLAVVLIVFIALVYIVLHSLKTVVLTYDEIILIKDYIGFLKRRIPYFEIKEVRFVPFEKSFASPEERWRYTQEGDEGLTRGRVWIKTRKGKIYGFEVESPNMFVKLVRERKEKFKLQAKFSRSRR